jgi:NADH dehydrogenase [ubiquinone] 1 alpha subcomplex assembly factor 6
VETAQVADQAKTEMLVLMRCQWWRDAVNDTFRGAAPEQPTMAALAEAMRARPLTRYRLQRVVTAREEDMLRTQPLADLAAAEAYAEGTASQLLYLQLEAAGLGGAAAEHASSHLGKAVGLAALLRGTAHHAARQRTYLPADLCARHGVSIDEVLAGRLPPGLQDVVLAVASAAKAHLDEGRARAGDVPAAGRALMLPAVAAGMYLSALQRCDFDPFDARLQRGGGFSPLAYQLRLKWHLLRGTF